MAGWRYSKKFFAERLVSKSSLGVDLMLYIGCVEEGEFLQNMALSDLADVTKVLHVSLLAKLKSTPVIHL